MCLGDTSWSSAWSPFLRTNADLLVGTGHLWLTQTENLHPHCWRPGMIPKVYTAVWLWNKVMFFLLSCFIWTNLQRGVEDKFRFSTFCFQYVVYLVQFVLSLLLEPKKKGSYEVLTEVRESRDFKCMMCIYISIFAVITVPIANIFLLLIVHDCACRFSSGGHVQRKMLIFSHGSRGGGRISRSGTVGDVLSSMMT